MEAPSGPVVVQRALRAGHRPDIEGMRAVAILLVVAYHAGIEGVGGGFVGVDVFFVISGYLITAVLVDGANRQGFGALLDFYARRVRRLLPAFTLSFVVTSALALWLYAPFETAALRRTSLGAAAYVGNFVFARLDMDYFGGAASNPFLHVWSLAVEEQFYAVWPVVIVVGLAVGRRAGRPLYGTGLVVSVVAVGSFVLAALLVRREPTLAFYASPARAWELAAGGLAVLLPTTMPARRAALVAGLGLALIAVAAVAFGEGTAVPGPITLLPVLGTIAVLVAGASAPRAGPLLLLSNPPMQALGRLSYGWYLWHWPLLTLAAVAGVGRTLPARLAVVLVALAVAALSFRVVEHPIRSSHRLARRPLASLGIGVGLTCVAVTTALLTTGVAARAASSGEHRRYLAASALPALYEAGCALHLAQTRTPESCQFAATGGNEVIALFGDSHAGHWFPALERLAADRGARLVPYVKDACPTPDVTVFSVRLGRAFAECDVWRDRAVEAIIALRPSLVVAANASSYVRATRAGDHVLPLDAWLSALAETTRRLTAAGIPVVVIADTPSAGLDVTACLARRAWNGIGRECRFELAGSLDPGLARAEEAAIEAVDGAAYLSMNDAICSDALCEVEREGMILYRDGHHLTVEFSEALSGELDRRLRAAGPNEG